MNEHRWGCKHTYEGTRERWKSTLDFTWETKEDMWTKNHVAGGFNVLVRIVRGC